MFLRGLFRFMVKYASSLSIQVVTTQSTQQQDTPIGPQSLHGFVVIALRDLVSPLANSDAQQCALEALVKGMILKGTREYFSDIVGLQMVLSDSHSSHTASLCFESVRKKSKAADANGTPAPLVSVCCCSDLMETFSQGTDDGSNVLRVTYRVDLMSRASTAQRHCTLVPQSIPSLIADDTLDGTGAIVIPVEMRHASMTRHYWPLFDVADTKADVSGAAPTLKDMTSDPPLGLVVSLEGVLKDASYKIGLLKKYGA